MALKTGTICSKHDDIMTLAAKMEDIISEIGDLADKCKDDGTRMEQGLDEKAKRIKELEAQVEDLEGQLKEAEGVIEALHEEAKNMEAEIKAAQEAR